ncbi:MAG: YfhO family protein [Chitinophagaceae bacterium]|nr:YfhO family protein [Chitinophagaceae bacterium]
MYIGMDYSNEVDNQIIAGYKDQSGSDAFGRTIVSSLKAERKAMFGGQILRTLGIAALAAVTIYLFLKQKINAVIAAVLLLVVSTLDITISSYKYFNNDNDQYAERRDSEKLFVSADDYTSQNFAPDAIDQEILKDKSYHYRVFNMAGTSNGSPFSESRTSYFHKSVGGYHPAKLRIYQDIIEKYLSGMPNPGVLNMLNTKYIIVPDPQTGQPGLIPNPDAFGACWLVSNVKVVEDRVASLKVLGVTNLKDTAIVEKDAAKNLAQPQRDSLSSISLTKFDNDKMEYQANCNGPQFAVFSEVYYPVGWNAYVDGKKAEYLNVNYILRGISLPAGKHKVEFVFEPESVKKGRSVMFIASILIVIVLFGGLFMAWKTNKDKTTAV